LLDLAVQHLSFYLVGNAKKKQEKKHVLFDLNVLFPKNYKYKKALNNSTDKLHEIYEGSPSNNSSKLASFLAPVWIVAQTEVGQNLNWCLSHQKISSDGREN
jgi:hypothetical protein